MKYKIQRRVPASLARNHTTGETHISLGWLEETEVETAQEALDLCLEWGLEPSSVKTDDEGLNEISLLRNEIERSRVKKLREELEELVAEMTAAGFEVDPDKTAWKRAVYIDGEAVAFFENRTPECAIRDAKRILKEWTT